MGERERPEEEDADVDREPDGDAEGERDAALLADSLPVRDGATEEEVDRDACEGVLPSEALRCTVAETEAVVDRESRGVAVEHRDTETLDDTDAERDSDGVLLVVADLVDIVERVMREERVAVSDVDLRGDTEKVGENTVGDADTDSVVEELGEDVRDTVDEGDAVRRGVPEVEPERDSEALADAERDGDGEAVLDRDTAALALNVPDCVGARVGVRSGDVLLRCVTERDSVALTDGDRDARAELDGESDTDAHALGLGEGEAECDADGEREPETDALLLRVKLVDTVGDTLRSAVAESLGDSVALPLPELEPLAVTDVETVRERVGERVEERDTLALGVRDTAPLDEGEWLPVRDCDGDTDTDPDDDAEVDAEGLADTDSVARGDLDARTVREGDLVTDVFPVVELLRDSERGADPEGDARDDLEGVHDPDADAERERVLEGVPLRACDGDNDADDECERVLEGVVDARVESVRVSDCGAVRVAVLVAEGENVATASVAVMRGVAVGVVLGSIERVEDVEPLTEADARGVLDTDTLPVLVRVDDMEGDGAGEVVTDGDTPAERVPVLVVDEDDVSPDVLVAVRVAVSVRVLRVVGVEKDDGKAGGSIRPRDTAAPGAPPPRMPPRKAPSDAPNTGATADGAAMADADGAAAPGVPGGDAAADPPRRDRPPHDDTTAHPGQSVNATKDAKKSTPTRA